MRELLVKLRGYSYLRSKWLSVAEIEADGPLSVNVLKKFEKLRAAGEPIDLSFRSHLIIERVIAHRSAHGHLEYLAKPMGLPYAEASWERLHALRQPDALKAIAKYHAPPLNLTLILTPTLTLTLMLTLYLRGYTRRQVSRCARHRARLARPRRADYERSQRLAQAWAAG